MHYFDFALAECFSLLSFISLPDVYFLICFVCSKWKGDKTSVYSICICPGGSTLLSAGRTIQLWNLQTKAVLKVS